MSSAAVSPIDDMSISLAEEEEEPTSTLLLPRQGSFRSQSSTCLPTERTPSPPIWPKITDQTPLTYVEDLELIMTTRKSSGESSSQKSNKEKLRHLDPRTEKHIEIQLQQLKSEKEEQLSPFGRKIIVFVGVSLLFLSVFLVGATLRLTPFIDEMVRKENEELYRSMSSGTTGAPVPNGSGIVDNGTLPANGQPG